MVHLLHHPIIKQHCDMNSVKLNTIVNEHSQKRILWTFYTTSNNKFDVYVQKVFTILYKIYVNLWTINLQLSFLIFHCLSTKMSANTAAECTTFILTSEMNLSKFLYFAAKCLLDNKCGTSRYLHLSLPIKFEIYWGSILPQNLYSLPSIKRYIKILWKTT